MYQIAWSDNGLDGLAELAVLYQNRWADINSAVNLIEFRLQRFPMTFGREVSEGLWRIDVEPVSVTFTMADKEIFVESIGWVG